VHTIANVNVDKDEKRQEKQGNPPRDPTARWGVKHTRRVKLVLNLKRMVKLLAGVNFKGRARVTA
jgi:hypothetical protein